MSFVNKYPYTDFHELNLDWFLEEFKKVTDKVDTLEVTVQQFTEFVTNYFDNLDVQQEINNKLDQMVADGTMAALLQPFFNELSERIDDQNVDIANQNLRIATLEDRMDTFASLPPGATSGNAELLDIRVGMDGHTYASAGDAVRDQFKDLKAFNAAVFPMSNTFFGQASVVRNGVTITFNADGSIDMNGLCSGSTYLKYFDTAFDGLPDGFKPGDNTFIYFNASQTTLQWFSKNNNMADNWSSLLNFAGSADWRRLPIPSDSEGLFGRLTLVNGTNYNDHIEVHVLSKAPNMSILESSIVAGRGNLASMDLNDLHATGWYTLISGNTYTNKPAQGAANAFLNVVRSGNFTLQIWYDFTGNEIYKRRSITANTWEDWQPIDSTKGMLASMDLNDLTETGWYLIDSGSTYVNAPLIGAYGAFLRVVTTYDYTLQLWYTYSGGEIYKRRSNRYQTTWEAWQLISGGGTTINNYNSYSLTVTPSVYTDNSSYLAASGDTSDRTADIESMLATGVCRLGQGDFYVKDVQMPDGTMIVGQGKATRLFLITGAGCAVQLGSNCVVKDVFIDGSASDITPSGTPGNRHGLLWQGTYDQDQISPTEGMIENVFIHGFTGAGIFLNNTGGPTNRGLIVSNAYIWNCSVGVDVYYLSEYSKFTNVRTFECYTGCINNGGNNVFVNCDFSKCTQGFLIDNDGGQSPNSAHGSCIGCLFNHEGNNTGYAIRVLGAPHGFVFDGCQMFFGKIELKNSDGIIVTGCNFGSSNNDISITGGNTTLFVNSMFKAQPVITVTGNTKVHFINCYETASGNMVS